MIIVIVVKERDPKTGRIQDVVSHGIDVDNDDAFVVMQNGSPASVGATWDVNLQEYVIEDKLVPSP